MWIIRINADNYGPFETEKEAREYFSRELKDHYNRYHEKPAYILLHK